MKSLIFFVFLLSLILPTTISGQPRKPNFVGEWYRNTSQGKRPEKVDVFSKSTSDFPRTKRYNLKANANRLNSVMNTKPDFIDITIPYGDKTYTLNLARVEVTSEDFTLRSNSGNVHHDKGAQYRGIVNNNPAYIASLSLTKTDKSGYFSTDEGNFVITNEGVDFIVYNEQEMAVPGVIFCTTPDVTFQVPVTSELITGIGCKTVNVYFECDYAMYQAKGSNVQAVSDYVIGFFNQVATLYANENVAIQISEIFTWTVSDPYVSKTSNSDILNTFRANRGTSFNGHIAHFLSTRTPLGGMAYVDALCNKAYAYGVSRISSTYSTFPTYSWTVNVVAHELGHTLASPHTHSCSWTGGALDNCVAPEGTCAPGPAPIGGGTIMSYCHTTSTGINFNNGFGLQPGNLIRNRVLNASCITAGTSATAPITLSTTNVTSNSATLNWNAVPGANSYTAQYKLASASTWTTTGATASTSMNITGLTAGSNYVWAVRSDCSAYSANASFTTTTSTSGSSCTYPVSLTTSNVGQTSATLNWGAVAGATSYSVQYRPTSSSTWSSLLSTTTNSLALTGLTAGTSYTWQVKANCSLFSALASFTTTTATSTTCAYPTSLNTTNISQTGATLTWGAVSGATSYTVQFKPTSSSTWNAALNTTTNSLSLTGLLAGTGYSWQVKANCSAYSGIATFTTTTSTSTTCSAPTQLSSTGLTQTGATLTWGAVVGATGYTIQYKTATASTWLTTTSTINSKAIIGLSANTNYVWQVKANCSGYSTQASFTTPAATSTTGCAVPTGLSESNITNNAATLQWTGPSNASTYSIRYKLVGASGWTIKNGITGNSYRITGLLSKRNYQWVISAKCSNGTTSSLSPAKYFTTL